MPRNSMNYDRNSRYYLKNQKKKRTKNNQGHIFLLKKKSKYASMFRK